MTKSCGGCKFWFKWPEDGLCEAKDLRCPSDYVCKECQSKAWDVTRELVIEKSKEGYSFTEETITDIHSYLVKKCSMNSGITI